MDLLSIARLSKRTPTAEDSRSAAEHGSDMNPFLRTTAVALLMLSVLVACGDDSTNRAESPSASSASPSTSNDTTEEVINPCSPEASPDETALEGETAAPGTPMVDVKAHDEGYRGVPATLPAGPRGFRLVGAGDEFHEMALIRLQEGEKRSVLDLLDLHESTNKDPFEYVGGVTACPGDTSEALGADLTPGRYALVCFVPAGTTPDLEGPELLAVYERPPHYQTGMLAEFVVN